MNREEIIKAIEEMSVLELSELVKELEDKFGVSAAAPMAAMPAAAAGGAVAEEEEQTEFDVVYKAVGSNKIATIKIIREITGLGLKEAKELADNPPKPLKEGVTKEEAEELKKKLEEVGAEVEVK